MSVPESGVYGLESRQDEVPCPACGSPIKNYDDVLMHFEGNEDPDHVKISPFTEMGPQQLAEALECTIKYDNSVKNITFLAMLLAQTEGDQFNIAYSSRSSSGKSYIATQLKQYFPKGDVITYAGASPTSFYYEYGTQVLEEGGVYVPLSDSSVAELRRELDGLNAIGKKLTHEQSARKNQLNSEVKAKMSNAKRLVDLKGKIVVFLDQHNSELLERMRTVLSHDEEYTEFHITNKNTTGTNRTERILIRGFPSVIFCTAGSLMDEQESTRFVILSPSSEVEKIEESLKLIDERMSSRAKFEEWLDEHPDRKRLMFRIATIRLSGITKFESQVGKVRGRFLAQRPTYKRRPRDTRDLTRLYCLVYGYALLNCFNRTLVDDGTIEATDVDIENAFHDYNEVSAANDYGLSPEVYDFYRKVVLPTFTPDSDGLGKRQMGKAYFDIHAYPINSRVLDRNYVPALLQSGLLAEVKDPNDGRHFLYKPTMFEEISAQGVGKSDSEKQGLHPDTNEHQSTLPTGHADTSKRDKEGSLK
jgi:hypothetical protein